MNKKLCAILAFTLVSILLQGNEMKHPESMHKIEASYGSWISPITAEKTASGTTSILNMQVDGETTYWCEVRPTNKGRYTVVRCESDGTLGDATPSDFNVRTTVHEYGGGAFAVKNGIIYASNGTDLKIYIIKPNQEPIPLTEGQHKVLLPKESAIEGTRFADLRALTHGLIAVAEHHSPGQPVENYLAWIDTITGEHKKIAFGYDFYSSPAISSDEKKIAWICWNHPNMPWTNTELWAADLKPNGAIENAQCVAGRDLSEAIFQPQWSPYGELFFVTDRDKGWWNLHRFHEGKVENVCPMEAEVAEPLWVFDRSTYAFLGNKILFAYNKEGFWNLALLDPSTKEVKQLNRDATYIQQLRSGPGFVEFLESYADQEEALVRVENKSELPTQILYEKETDVPKGYISTPRHVTFQSGNRTAYGFFYPPQNQDYIAPHSEKPPLLVMIHGGPTSQAKGTFQLSKQYWTSQGFALLDVNYGGSTGYGRPFRQALDTQWGVVDVEDCINGARYLSEQGLVDPDKLIIRGGSAGGFTTLAALAYDHTFKAGGNYFGVADITALAQDTHKFEAHYTDTLVGLYPEEKELWESRSPINSADKIQSPLIIFQGEDDPVVPKNQSIMIYEALKRKGVKVELHIYPGEEHGFRQAKNIIHSLRHEADFYRTVFDKEVGEKGCADTHIPIPSPYMEFSRETWRQFRRDTPMCLAPAELEKLQGQLERVSMEEVEEIYLPLTRLLNLYIEASKSLYDVTERFLGHDVPKVPYIIGVAGSVAVGKSTTSRIIQALLSHSFPDRYVEIVTTDGFLYPNAVLEQKGLMERKGFPESFNIRRLVSFLSDLKAGKSNLSIPIYSHHTYDIVPGSYQLINQPDIVIVEGLNVLQIPPNQRHTHQLFVSDFFDISIYVDAEATLIKKWFLERFSLFRDRAKHDTSTYFHQFAQWPDEKAFSFAEEVWTQINERNLFENILPFRQRAQLILSKGENHAVEKIQLRKL